MTSTLEYTMKQTTMEHTRDAALFELEKRQALAKEKGRINNASLYAGSPMYYYCRHCGLESDVLPESWSPSGGGGPRRICTPCSYMKKEGWL